MSVGVNFSAGLGEPLLGVSPPLEVAPLLVLAPLEVSPPLEVEPLARSMGLSVVQVRLGCKRDGSSGGVEADWGISWVCLSEPYVSTHA